MSSLLHVLTQFHQVTVAEELQSQFEGFLASIQRIIPLVWVQEESSDVNTVCCRLFLQHEIQILKILFIW